jgi:hypothetical protein
VIGLAIVLLAACKDEPGAIATLTETSPGVQKQTGAGPWTAAAVGVKFFRGDAVQTADGEALLRLGPAAALRVKPKSLIRFGASKGKSSIAVELGEATLEGTGGTYQLGLGAVTLDGQSTVRLTPGDATGTTRVELVLGAATLEEDGGAPTAMAAGQTYVLGLGAATLEPERRADAAMPDAAIADAAPMDAAPVAAADVVAVVVTGRRAETKPEGGTWQSLPAGDGELAAGAELKIGRGSTVKASRPGVTLEMSAGGRMKVGGDPFMTVSAGELRATGADGDKGKVALPGGQLVLDGARTGAAIEIKRRETEIAVTRGVIELVGSKGKVPLQQGETAILRADGQIRIMNAVPKYFDLRVEAGASFTVHDPNPRPGTAVRFDYDCGGDGTVELGKDGFRAPRVSGGNNSANMMVPPGAWRYRVRCDNGRSGGSGKITVKRDSGTKSLPPVRDGGTNYVDADGMKYVVNYQNLRPKVVFRWKKATGGALTLNVAKGADVRTWPARGGSVTVGADELDDGVYSFYFTTSEGGRSPTSPLIMQYDNATPSAYIEEPKNATAWGGQIRVKGAVMPGYTASVEGVAMTLDRARRFDTQISPPSANAIAIKLSHSRFGVHYYLRRQK